MRIKYSADVWLVVNGGICWCLCCGRKGEAWSNGCHWFVISDRYLSQHCSPLTPRYATLTFAKLCTSNEYYSRTEHNSAEEIKIFFHILIFNSHHVIQPVPTDTTPLPTAFVPVTTPLPTAWHLKFKYFSSFCWNNFGLTFVPCTTPVPTALVASPTILTPLDTALPSAPKGLQVTLSFLFCAAPAAGAWLLLAGAPATFVPLPLVFCSVFCFELLPALWTVGHLWRGLPCFDGDPDSPGADIMLDV